jgi:hypothetical protein
VRSKTIPEHKCAGDWYVLANLMIIWDLHLGRGQDCVAHVVYFKKSSFHKFYCCYNDLVCDYKFSPALMLNNLFHTLGKTVVSILALTTDNLVYLISAKGVRCVWPVSRGWLPLHGIWSYLTSVVLHSILYWLFGLWLHLIHY